MAGAPPRGEARARLKALADEIIDADDRLAIAERELLAPLDAQAKRAIAGAAKQVSLVTAVSPRAIVDVAFVIFAAVRLLRTLARIYGGRPGLFGFLRLARAAFNHLAVTGGVAVGDSLMQQVLGLGLAARISAKLGEGVLERPDDRPLRPRRARRLPPAALHPRGRAEDRRCGGRVAEPGGDPVARPVSPAALVFRPAVTLRPLGKFFPPCGRISPVHSNPTQPNPRFLKLSPLAWGLRVSSR